jgi:hypothetical protein
MDAEDRLRLDYEQTAQLVRTLVDVRVLPVSQDRGLALVHSAALQAGPTCPRGARSAPSTSARRGRPVP